MSLADELLADLDNAEPAEDEEENSFITAIEADEVKTDSEINQNFPSKIDLKEDLSSLLKPHKLLNALIPTAPISKFAKLRDSEKLTTVMQQIDVFSKQPKRESVSGPVEADPEYLCIVQANDLIVEIDNEINIIHKYTRDIYQHRFPELESLVSQPMDYMKIVLVS
ncbi:unnamed protein product [Dibothriocephalus latus]|uniref:NOSIC domain-containing protein n=1 Tax=Dibothriocephalus latus TaxID=60516 RepID=A0A3P7M8U6_DIBLA|nr:unnamed protein product [Dibothriocephalus latus]